MPDDSPPTTSDRYRLQRASKVTARGEPIVLREAETSCLVLLCQSVDNRRNPKARLQVTLQPERKNRNGDWERDDFSLATLKALSSATISGPNSTGRTA